MWQVANTWTFESVLDQFRVARAWVDGLGVPTAGTRFEMIENDVTAAVDAWRRQDMSGLTGPEDLKAATYALVEAQDINAVYRAYGGRRTAGVIARLRQAVRGPRSGEQEQPPDNAGRNFLAELSWGAMLELNGFATDLETDPDVLQRVALVGTPGASISWEVKRPLGPQGVVRNITKGAEQVEEAYKGTKSAAGTEVIGGGIVVMMDHVLLEDPVVIAESPASAAALMRSRLERYVKDSIPAVHAAARKDGVRGIVYLWRPLGVFPGPDGRRRYQACTQISFDDSVYKLTDTCLDYMRTTVSSLGPV